MNQQINEEYMLEPIPDNPLIPKDKESFYEEVPICEEPILSGNDMIEAESVHDIIQGQISQEGIINKQEEHSQEIHSLQNSPKERMYYFENTKSDSSSNSIETQENKSEEYIRIWGEVYVFVEKFYLEYGLYKMDQIISQCLSKLPNMTVSWKPKGNNVILSSTINKLSLILKKRTVQNTKNVVDVALLYQKCKEIIKSLQFILQSFNAPNLVSNTRKCMDGIWKNERIKYNNTNSCINMFKQIRQKQLTSFFKWIEVFLNQTRTSLHGKLDQWTQILTHYTKSFQFHDSKWEKLNKNVMLQTIDTFQSIKKEIPEMAWLVDSIKEEIENNKVVKENDIVQVRNMLNEKNNSLPAIDLLLKNIQLNKEYWNKNCAIGYRKAKIINQEYSQHLSKFISESYVSLNKCIVKLCSSYRLECEKLMSQYMMLKEQCSTHIYMCENSINELEQQLTKFMNTESALQNITEFKQIFQVIKDVNLQKTKFSSHAALCHSLKNLLAKI